ncbi:hypothetical protein M9458_052832 [Cirrhinus mrigala]|uniref:Gypsy retrotransposon integrase-like protein 1 n=1 Tax=Cirrhinus mrigala TaxID=683832 RepID=A0ABD0MTE6_CIRMR
MEVDFEVDTGCGVTIISREQYSKLWKKTDMPEWTPCTLKLKTYTGEKMEVLGQATVTVDIQNPLVEAELQRLVEEKIIEPVQFAEWAAPIVPVKKPDGSIWICGDYKLTVNRASSVEQYPIPKVEDLFAQLAGGQKFSKLDMSHAYQQIMLDESAKKYVTVNTHKGLYTYCRLPFGVASSPAIFQHTMEGILQNMRHVTVYMDDILVTGANDEEHLKNLEEVLRRLKTGLSGLRLKRSKCEFLGEEVIFLGHRISAAGVQPVAEKVQAIQEAPTPQTVSELKAYLGLLNYYHKFMPSLSTVLAPLHSLLKKETKWMWGREQEEAFIKSKELLQSSAILVHYDPTKPLILACDASPYGVGAVLSHRMENGTDRPIGFASRTLNEAEKKYSQLDKEGLAVIFGVKKFHTYVFGRPFTIVTDHKPLIALFNELREVPQMASPRIQRWAVTLGGYEYTIVYRAGQKGVETPAEEERVLVLDENDVSLIKAEQVEKWTVKDPVLARAGQPYSGHPGITRMKGLARSYVWWPQMDVAVEGLVKACARCQESRNTPPCAPLHPWEIPKLPCRRIHIDYAGPWQGKMFLILVDAYSKWIEAFPLNSATSAVTIQCLRQSFSQNGLPEIVVSDNGSCFTSKEFNEFTSRNGIKHITTAPYHAASNGLVERAVQTFKSLMKKTTGDSTEARIARALFSYRITPQSTTGKSLAELLCGRKLRSTLDLIHPDFKSQVQDKQLKQKWYHDQHAKERHLSVGENVYTKNFSSGPTWISGTVQKKTGPLSYTIALGSGQVVRRHIDQVRNSQVVSPAGTAVGLESSLQDVTELPLPESISPAPSGDSVGQPTSGTTTEVTVSETLKAEEQPELRRSTRTRKLPSYLKDFA